MSYLARMQYLIAIKDRYLKSKKKEKKLMLDEFCAICRYSRKHAIKLLNRPISVKEKRPGVPSIYKEGVKKHLKILWNVMGRICSKRVKKALPEWIKYYEMKASLSSLERSHLLQMSPASIDRFLKEERRIRGQSTTRKNSKWYKSRIPVRAEDRSVKEVGFIVSDTVAHCGSNIGGIYTHSLTVTDLATAWTENRALWGKSQQSVCEAMRKIEESLPFNICGFKSDCGTEFINHKLFNYFTKREEPVPFYRSRPYQKNDNCHVEQKNLSHVRRLFGYERFDDIHLIPLMNEIYSKYWNPLNNFFMPTMKLIGKERVHAKMKKTFDAGKTPFDRVMESTSVSLEDKQSLAKRKALLNPFDLRLQLEVKLKLLKEKVSQVKNLTQVI